MIDSTDETADETVRVWKDDSCAGDTSDSMDKRSILLMARPINNYKVDASEQVDGRSAEELEGQ